ncbi:MAG: penicillin-binding protein 2 [Actinomycetota bacterium]
MARRGLMSSSQQEQQNLDRLKLRLAVLAVLVIAAFVALYSRLWFLQVLAADDFESLAQQNRVRLVYSEPDRGRILDRNGYVLVDNRLSTSVTVDREIAETPVKKRAVFRRLSELLKIPVKELDARLQDVTVSPYKPVVVANDVPLRAVARITGNPENYPGVHIEKRPVRFYPQGPWAAQILGYVGEITDVQLKDPYFKNARPRYQPGDVVGRSGLELAYDRELRGKPQIEQVVVNSASKAVDSRVVQEAEEGNDLITTLDIRIQRIAEQALASGIRANRNLGLRATDGAAVVMDPNTGGVVAMASYPTYDPAILSDGLQTREFDKLLGHGTEAEYDDAEKNRAIQVAYSPGSTFKLATAMAAMGLGLADSSTYLPCPGSVTLGEGTGAVTFPNWTSRNYGNIGFARSMEVSCDTFYYELGWQMESRWGVGLQSGDDSEKYQKFLRMLGFDEPTGIDLPGEIGGTIADQEWLEEYCAAVGRGDDPTCTTWYPGYTVNMSIGQGDAIVTPLQMALNYVTLLNDGKVLRPRVADFFGRPKEELSTTQEELPTPEPLIETTISPSGSPTPSPSSVPSPSSSPTPSPSPSGSTLPEGEAARTSLDEEKIVQRIKTKIVRRVPLEPDEIAVLKQGLEDVVMGAEGTGASAFVGFPLDRYPVAGKTGTAQIGETDFNRAWFVSYAPADDPEYVVAVYMNYADHGGTSAAPVAREIYEGIFGIDQSTDDVNIGSDASG